MKMGMHVINRMIGMALACFIFRSPATILYHMHEMSRGKQPKRARQARLVDSDQPLLKLSHAEWAAGIQQFPENRYTICRRTHLPALQYIINICGIFVDGIHMRLFLNVQIKQI